jgi:protein-arginine deiminase
MGRYIRWCATAAILAAVFGACHRSSGGGGGDPPYVSPPPAPPPPPPPPVVDLDVDTNRNGTVQEPADEAGEDAWTPALGAVFYYNIDDDDNSNVVDYFDTAVNGANDALDLARIVVRQMPSLPTTATLTITVSTAARGRVRIFRNNGGTWSQEYATGAAFNVPAALAIAGDVEMGIEARERYSPLWNGRVTLVLEARDSTGTLLGTDTVLLKCAPWIMSSNLWTMEDLCVVNVGSSNANFRTALSSVCTTAGVTYVPIPGGSYSYDPWVQDSHETGAIYLPASGVARRRIDNVLQCARWRQIDAWCQDSLWGPDFDFVQVFDNDNQSTNYGGNLEVTGPLASYPWGRILVGGGTGVPIGGGNQFTRRMVQSYRDYFDALEIQGPWLEISTEWLAVGHVDEITMVVPAPASQRGWAILIASPDLARANLQAVANNGGGSLAVFAGRGGGWATTVNAILGNSSLMTYNDEVQTRIDGVRTVLQNQLGLAASEIIDLPVLFEPISFYGAAAYNPGVVNMIVIPSTNGTTYLVVPDPEGPDQPGDVWQATTTAAIQPLFTAGSPVVITYADIWNTYHVNLGEAHCGTNFVRTPPASDWWDDP